MVSTCSLVSERILPAQTLVQVYHYPPPSRLNHTTGHIRRRIPDITLSLMDHPKYHPIQRHGQTPIPTIHLIPSHSPNSPDQTRSCSTLKYHCSKTSCTITDRLIFSSESLVLLLMLSWRDGSCARKARHAHLYIYSCAIHVTRGQCPLSNTRHADISFICI